MKKTIKSIILILISAILICSVCACGSSKSEKEDSVEDKVASAAKSRINTYIVLKYEIQGSPTITAYVDEIADNTYEVTGKVTVQDKYGDKYTGKYDAEVTYDPEEDKCKVTSYDVGELRRSS